jgi:hypothetical protein
MQHNIVTTATMAAIYHENELSDKVIASNNVDRSDRYL